MQYKALYRKYRPSKFEDVVGQDPIVKTLQNSVKENKISHAYLFSGPRGSGKTSVAKLLAKTVNCLDQKNGSPCDACELCMQVKNGTMPDIIEIDAASNNGVDEIREIRSKVNLLPAVGKYKVYIIDEVHMLSTGAFNALLKTLEEPPKHVIFILATTEIHKLPLTIISRCQRFDFKRISVADVIKKLKEIVIEEKIEIDEEALELIAHLSDGGLRDAVGLLDQAALYSEGEISVAQVNEIVGAISKNELSEIVNNILNSDVDLFLIKLDLHNANGRDLKKIATEMMVYIKDLIIYFKVPNYFENNKVVETDSFKLVNKVDLHRIYELLDILNETVMKMRDSNYPKLLLEVNVLKYMNVADVEFSVMNSVVIEEKMMPAKIFESNLGNNDEPAAIEPIIETVTSIRKESDKKKLVVDGAKIPELTKIRVNNVLAQAKKEELDNVKNKWFTINEYSIDKKLGMAAGLLLDANVVVAGENHLLIAYPYQTVVDRVNGLLIEVEKVISKALGKKYKVIAVSEEIWEKEKAEFVRKNKNKEKYVMITENVEYLVEKEMEKDATLDGNNIVDLLGDIVEVK